MNLFNPGRITVALSLALIITLGCSKSAPPPTPLAIEEIPAALEKAFSKAGPEIKSLAGQAADSVRARDYSKAFLAIQNLANSPELTKEQQSVTSRATLTVNSLLQAAQSQGDSQAAQTLQNYRRDK